MVSGFRELFYAWDSQGRPTTDPEAALDGGVVLPIGGPKGSGLAMMMDIFSGVMTGAAFAGGVNDQYSVLDEPQGVGHWFLVFRPELCLEGAMAQFRERMDALLRTVRSSKKAEGFDRIYVSGEMEAAMEKQRAREGISFTQSEIDTLHELGKQSGVGSRLVRAL